MNDRELTIFDVRALDEADAWKRVRTTITDHRVSPASRIYDEACLAELIRQRTTSEGYLLFWLAQRDDETACAFWDLVTADLTALEHEGALESYRAKMRRDGCADFQSWRTELWFPAWLKRAGIGIALAPPVGSREADFLTRTEPVAFWEIKSPLDLANLQEDAAVLLDVQRRLRNFPSRMCST